MVDANKAFGFIKDSRILAGLEVSSCVGFVVVAALLIVVLLLLALFSANRKWSLFRNNIDARRIPVIAKITYGLVCFFLIKGNLSCHLKKQKCHILLIFVLFTFIKIRLYTAKVIQHRIIRYLKPS